MLEKLTNFFASRWGIILTGGLIGILGPILQKLGNPPNMGMYQAGIPLSYIKDFLGHASINTTDIYASTDISMMRAALERIGRRDSEQIPKETPVWQDNEELILKLCGLK